MMSIKNATKFATSLLCCVAMPVVAIGLSFSALCLDMWFTGTWLLALGLLFASRRLIRIRLAKRFHAIAIAGLVVCAALGWSRPFVELGRFMDVATADIEERGEHALDRRQRVGFFTLNLFMGFGGHLLGLHEVAFMTWLMALPGPSVRVRDGEFLLRDPKVKRAVATLQVGKRVTLAWREYLHPDVSPSVSLAANCPLLLEAFKPAEAGVERLIRGQCNVAYPKFSRLLMGTVRGQDVYVQEGGFWVLQRAGWLHSYVVQWEFAAPAETEPKQANLTPELGLRERLLLLGHRAIWTVR